METIHIALPEPVKHFVDAQIATGAYRSVSEYVCTLVNQDQRRKAQEQLDALRLEAAESSAAAEMTQDDWNLWP